MILLFLSSFSSRIYLSNQWQEGRRITTGGVITFPELNNCEEEEKRGAGESSSHDHHLLQHHPRSLYVSLCCRTFFSPSLVSAQILNTKTSHHIIPVSGTEGSDIPVKRERTTISTSLNFFAPLESLSSSSVAKKERVSQEKLFNSSSITFAEVFFFCQNNSSLHHIISRRNFLLCHNN